MQCATSKAFPPFLTLSFPLPLTSTQVCISPSLSLVTDSSKFTLTQCPRMCFFFLFSLLLLFCFSFFFLLRHPLLTTHDWWWSGHSKGCGNKAQITQCQAHFPQAWAGLPVRPTGPNGSSQLPPQPKTAASAINQLLTSWTPQLLLPALCLGQQMGTMTRPVTTTLFLVLTEFAHTE